MSSLSGFVHIPLGSKPLTITRVARSGLGTRLNRKCSFLRSSCLILLTCSVSISFLVACLSKVKFIFVVVTNACCDYFVYIYGAFIKYLKVLFSCVCCLPHRLTVKLCFKAVVKVKKANDVIIINYINPRRVAEAFIRVTQSWIARTNFFNQTVFHYPMLSPTWALMFFQFFYSMKYWPGWLFFRLTI